MNFFWKREKKEEKKDCHRQTAHQPSSRAALGGRGRGDASNATTEQHIWSLGGRGKQKNRKTD